MSDHTPLNDSELHALEQRLAAATLSPHSSRREQLLYACGQAAGRAEGRLSLRRMYIMVASLACISAGLGFVLFTSNALPPQASDSNADLVAEQQQGGHQIALPFRDRVEAPGNDQRRLTASTSYEHLQGLDRDRPGELAHADPVGLTSQQVLTPTGGPSLEDLWN